MIDGINEWIAFAIYWIGLAAWRTLPVFIVVLSLDWMLRKLIPAKYLCVLWMIVVARLLLPVSAGSPLAVTRHLDDAFAALFVSEESPPSEYTGSETFTYRDDDGKTLMVRQPVLRLDATAEEIKAAESKVVVLEESSIQPQNTSLSGVESDYDVFYSVVAYSVLWSWLLGFTFIASRGTLAYLRFSLRLRKQSVIEDQSIVDQVLRACDRVGVGRRPKIKEVESLDAPAVFGLFRPVICLPTNWREQLSGERLDWVLRHELTHVRRRDSLVMFIASVARALHWFHPLSWIAFSKLQSNVERAADEAVTRGLSESSIRDYGNLLLHYAAQKATSWQNATIGLLAMALPRGLQGRIESLTTQPPKRWWLVRMAMIAVVAFVALTGLTDAEIAEPKTDASHRVPKFEIAAAEAELPPPHQMAAEENNQSSARTVSVNVEKALKKAESLQPGVDAERFIKLYFGPHPMTPEQLNKTTIVDGIMTFVATPRQEAFIKQTLVAFEQSGLWQIVTELYVIESDVRLLNWIDWSVEDGVTHCRHLEQSPQVEDTDGWQAAFSIDASTWSPHSTTSPAFEQSVSIPVRATRISRLNFERLRHQAQRERHTNIMSAPKVTVFNGQCVIVSDVVRRPFVTDVSFVPGEPASALQSRISIFESGWKFRVKPTVTEDERVGLQMVLTQSEINDVKLANLPRFSSDQPDGDITIQVPSVYSDSIAVETVLGADEALLVFSPTPYSTKEADGVYSSGRGRGQVFMIRTHLISDKDYLKDFVPTKSEE